ncbi:MAG: glycosyltransferase family 39 protein [Anaerolineae bacterium]|nr:glycosyltransferase family 39 protein [Anaerolineae bacterium]
MVQDQAWRVDGVRRIVWALVAVAVCLRLAALFAFHGPDLVSASESGLTAANWVAGRGHTFDFYGYRTASPLQSFMPPLFTAVIAGCLVTPWPEIAFSIVQVALSSLTVLLVYRIATRLADLAVGMAAAALTAVYPPFLILVDQNTVPVLNAFLLALWLWATICLIDRGGWRWATLAGLALGLNILSRPSSAGLLAVMLLGMGLKPRELGGRLKSWWRPAIMVVAMMGLTIAPWLARDLVVHRRFVWISTNGGFNFWVGNNPFTTGSCFDVVVADLAAYSGDAVSAPEGASIVQVKPYPLPLELRDTAATLDEVALDRALYGASFSFIQAHPGRWLGLLAQKLVSLWWFRPNVGLSSGFYQESWILPYRILYGGVLIAAIAGLILSLKHWRRYAVLYGMLAYLTVVYVAYHAITRYRWEMEPYLLALAALTLVTGWRRLSPVLPWKAR